MRLVTDVFEFCAARAARSGTRSRSAATTCARPGRPPPRSWRSPWPTRSRTCEAAVARGLDVDDFAGRLSFFFAAWSELFEEVAKFRVGAPDVGHGSCVTASARRTPRSMVCRFHVQTAGSSLTAQSIDNNVVRTTIQALAAVLGGAQSLHTNSRDEALALPTEEAARLALRTQQILAYEAGVTETPDPLAGSLLRREPDQRARGRRVGLPRRDRAHGRDARRDRGRLPAAPDPGGGVPRPAGDRAGDQVVVGVNKFTGRRGRTPPHPADRPRRRAAPDRAASGACGPSAIPAGLDGRDGRARATPRRGDGNLMPAILDAVRAYATVGEISDRLRVGLGRAPRADHGLTTITALDRTGLAMTRRVRWAGCATPDDPPGRRPG